MSPSTPLPASRALWERLEALLPDALDLAAEDRTAFLDSACVGPDGAPDAVLRREAESLLGAYASAESAGSFLTPFDGISVGPIDDVDDSAESVTLPERIGPWRVTGLLGRGGMGVVYAAERDDASFTQRAAVKRVRPEVSDDFRARFVHERAVLAGLEHDGIARLLDGGMADGAPFLAMERVDGEPITAYADEHALSVPARLRLFLQVCDAVAYAHGGLVVHRDLKPSNVLVTADGRVKLLDFGVAKLLSADADADETRTRAALTPAYAAPEQLRGGRITTATDVYALGVMLHELLAGKRPYAIAGSTAAEAERVVCETVPPTPSSMAPPERAGVLRGDLDTIVAKALAKEPARRYASAEALGDDVQRHLDGLPVRARPATASYRARRFVRRHRLGVTAAALVSIAVVGGAGVALWQANQAKSEADKATAVSEFLVGLLGAADPTGAGGRDVRVATLLDDAAANVDSAFAGQPETAALVRHTLGSTYLELGLYTEAQDQLRQALDIRTRVLGPDSPDVIESQRWLGEAWLLDDKLGSADSILTIALATARRTVDKNDLTLGHVLSALGYVRFIQADYEASLAMHRESTEIQQAQPDVEEEEVAAGLGNQAIVLDNLGRSTEAVPVLEEQLAVYRRLFGEKNARVARALDNLGATYQRLGRYEDARRTAALAVATFQQTVAPESPELAGALSNLSPPLLSLGRSAEAEKAARSALQIFEASVGPNHRRTASARIKLGQAIHAQGRTAEGERLVRQALADIEANSPEGHPARAYARVALGRILLESRRAAQAVPLLREAVALRDAALPDGHPDRAAADSLLGAALTQAR